MAHKRQWEAESQATLFKWAAYERAAMPKLDLLFHIPIYQCGFHRIGCIGCPMASSQEKAFQFERYPKFKVNYIKAFDRMIATRKEQDMPVDLWRTGEDVFNWWVSPAAEKIDPDQLGLFDEEESV